ncbi:uncharacterized protein METZ01_LOCUS509197 [marine metagenome]|uniref:Uncharacterized protein n=1 Tax=marine metagenome TaxID=408172 RepID=A0A383EIU5_9ZZZZ
MRHKTEYEARGIAHPCYVLPALVRGQRVGEDLVARARVLTGGVDVSHDQLA